MDFHFNVTHGRYTPDNTPEQEDSRVDLECCQDPVWAHQANKTV